MTHESERNLTVLAVDGSPTGGGRTRAGLRAVAEAAAAAGASVETIELAAGPDATARVVGSLERTDAVVFATPVYRASLATPLKRLLDAIPRGMPDSLDSPLAGKAVAAVLTGASLHHFLAVDPLRSVLAGFFAAHVVPPGLYLPRDAFDADLRLHEPYGTQARLQGAALVELSLALGRSSILRALRPQA